MGILSYTVPAADAVVFSFRRGTTYTPPASTEVDFQWQNTPFEVSGLVSTVFGQANAAYQQFGAATGLAPVQFGAGLALQYSRVTGLSSTIFGQAAALLDQYAEMDSAEGGRFGQAAAILRRDTYDTVCQALGWQATVFGTPAVGGAVGLSVAGLAGGAFGAPVAASGQPVAGLSSTSWGVPTVVVPGRATGLKSTAFGQATTALILHPTGLAGGRLGAPTASGGQGVNATVLAMTAPAAATFGAPATSLRARMLPTDQGAFGRPAISRSLAC